MKYWGKTFLPAKQALENLERISEQILGTSFQISYLCSETSFSRRAVLTKLQLKFSQVPFFKIGVAPAHQKLRHHYPIRCSNPNRSLLSKLSAPKSPEIPQTEWGFGLRNRSPKSQIASDIPSHP